MINGFKGKLFNLMQPVMYNNFLECIPSRNIDDDNEELHKTPMEEEIKDAIFNMSIESSAKPDHFNCMFFHTSWDIIKYHIC